VQTKKSPICFVLEVMISSLFLNAAFFGVFLAALGLNDLAFFGDLAAF
jgi:hypothetical protein